VIYQSLLFDDPSQLQTETTKETHECLIDLNLDQVFAAITGHEDPLKLLAIYHSPLKIKDRIVQRQKVFRDLGNDQLLEQVRKFAKDLHRMHVYLGIAASPSSYQHYQQGWFLEAAILYCNAVEQLAHDLSSAKIESPGLLQFRSYLIQYTQTQHFTNLVAETRGLKAQLAEITYSIIIQGLNVQVKKYQGEIDFSKEVTRLFKKFEQGAGKDYQFNIPDRPGMNHVGARILELVAKLYPDAFTHLKNYCEQNVQFADEGIRTFAGEIQFFLTYLDFITKLKSGGLEFCYPEISEKLKDEQVINSFDIALAARNVPYQTSVVTNDYYFQGPERIFVISGPNQGGKTTFARMFGQLHYLANLGCPVPGTKSRLFLTDGIFTHFEKQEDVTNLRGKLQDDLIRIHQILDEATPDSIVILNEIFTSTTLQDAVYLSRQIFENLVELDLLAVCVTFIDELSSLSEKTVSMVSTIDQKNPALRTFKIVRKPADGLSYAISIAEKHGLIYRVLKERIRL
jgi:DNA mismatch repair ATPase MutS